MMIRNRKEEGIVLLRIIRKSLTLSENRLTGFKPGLPKQNANS